MLWITQVQPLEVCDVDIKVCSESNRILAINASTETRNKIAHEIRVQFSEWRQGSSHAIQTTIMDIQFILSKLHANTSKLPNLVKLCFLPVYSQFCDVSRSRVHGDTAWPEELSDNYIAAVFIYYNTGNCRS